MSGVSALVMHQLETFTRAAVCGICLTAVYDGIRIFRRILRHGIVLVSLEDVLYWLLFAFSEFLLLYQVESGRMRAYVFLGSALGAAAYHLLFGRHLVRIVSGWISFVKGVLRKHGRQSADMQSGKV